MSQVSVFLLVLFKFVSVFGYPGETIMLMPPLEVRTVDEYPFSKQFPTSSSSNRQHQQILHTKLDPQLTTSSLNNLNHETIFNNFIEDLNAIQSHQKERESSQLRTANVGREGSDSAYHSYPGPYPQPRSPGYGSTQEYQKPTSTSAVLEPVIPKAASLKPDLSTLFKPVSTKTTSKVSGLLSLILALFSGSSSDGFKMNGLTEVVVNGIIKPLLVAKGGIKSLISKLTIPLIALLLINVEVLVTVWWLWEDCEPLKPSTPTYSYKKPFYNYNTYSSYR